MNPQQAKYRYYQEMRNLRSFGKWRGGGRREEGGGERGEGRTEEKGRGGRREVNNNFPKVLPSSRCPSTSTSRIPKQESSSPPSVWSNLEFPVKFY
jgi:hypothetical protein